MVPSELILPPDDHEPPGLSILPLNSRRGSASSRILRRVNESLAPSYAEDEDELIPPSTEATPRFGRSPRTSGDEFISKANSISSVNIDGVTSPSLSGLGSPSVFSPMGTSPALSRKASLTTPSEYSRKASLTTPEASLVPSPMRMRSAAPDPSASSSTWCAPTRALCGGGAGDASCSNGSSCRGSWCGAANNNGAMVPVWAASDDSSDDGRDNNSSTGGGGGGATSSAAGARPQQQPLRPASARKPYTKPAAGAAEEAKASASDTARAVAAAAAAAAAAAKGSASQSSSSLPSIPRLDTSAARAFASRSLNRMSNGPPSLVDTGPSAAELAKRKAEDAAREMARTAALAAKPRKLSGPRPAARVMPSPAPPPGAAAAVGGTREQEQQQQQAYPPRVEGEAEAIKHRASTFAKELAERFEREQAEKRRAASAGGTRSGSAGGGGGGAAVAAAAPASRKPTEATAASPGEAKAGSSRTNKASKASAAPAPTAAAPAALEAKRSARAPQKAWLLTLLKPEHRSARLPLSRSSSRTSRLAPEP